MPSHVRHLQEYVVNDDLDDLLHEVVSATRNLPAPSSASKCIKSRLSKSGKIGASAATAAVSGTGPDAETNKKREGNDTNKRKRGWSSIANFSSTRSKRELDLPPALADFTPLQHDSAVRAFLEGPPGKELTSLGPHGPRFEALTQGLTRIYTHVIDKRLEITGPELISKYSRVVLYGSHMFSKVYTSVWKLIAASEEEGLRLYQQAVAMVKEEGASPIEKYRSRQRPQASDIVVLFQDAAAAKPKFDEILTSIAKNSKHKLNIPEKLKNVHRVIEKSGLRHKHRFETDSVCDVVRAMVVTSQGMRGIAQVLQQIHKDPRLIIVRVKDRFLTCPSGGGWRDLMLNVRLHDDANRHVCEIQLVHPQLFNARAGMPGHKIYGIVRNAHELLERFMGKSAATKTLDVNAHNGVHSFAQDLQLKRSGVLSAPWVPVVDRALRYAYHNDLRYLFPHDTNYVLDQDLSATQEAPIDDDAEALLLNTCPAAFDSVWYIAALSRVPADILGKQLHAGLAACLSSATLGHDRFIAQMAVIAIGALHRGSRNGLLSRRLLQVWENHEISNVRADAALSLRAIAHPAYTALLNVALNLPGMQDATAMISFFEQTRLNVHCLDAAPVQVLLPLLDIDKCGHNVVLGALVSLCLTFECADTPGNEAYKASATALRRDMDSTASVEALMTKLIDAVDKLVDDPYVGHLIKTLSLESITRAIKFVRRCYMLEWQGSALANAVVDLADGATITSVFKSVRTAANALLKGASFELMGVYECFGGLATNRFKAKGFAPATIAGILEEHLLPKHLQQLRERVHAMSKPLHELEALFARSATSRQCRVLTEDPTLLLYTLMADYEQLQTPFNASFLQQRLNSENKLERYIGLVCIGCLCEQPVIAPLLVVVPLLVASEMISDVRDLAVALTTLRELSSTNNNQDVTSNQENMSMTNLKTLLVNVERDNLKEYVYGQVDI